MSDDEAGPLCFLCETPPAENTTLQSHSGTGRGSDAYHKDCISAVRSCAESARKAGKAEIFYQMRDFSTAKWRAKIIPLRDCQQRRKEAIDKAVTGVCEISTKGIQRDVLQLTLKQFQA